MEAMAEAEKFTRGERRRPPKKSRSKLSPPYPLPSSRSWSEYVQTGVKCFNIGGNVQGYS